MQHRVLVLGNTGMLGHMVEHVLAADERLVVQGVGRSEFDATQAFPPLFQRGGEGGCPNYVINCIGITARHINDSDPTSVARAIRVNAEFPHELAATAAEHGVRVIHMSTDGVFSGQSSTPYAEDVTPDATDTYGRMKILGESRASNVLNIRTSIIGPSPVRREGLWEWIVSQPDGATVDGYTNHIWHGVTTFQFAEFCTRILADELNGARGKTSGVEEEPKATGKHPMLRSARHSTFEMLRAGSHVLHFAPNAPVTKAELVEHIATALGKRMTVRPVVHGQPVHRVLAMRPDVMAMLGAVQPITAALHAVRVIAFGSPAAAP